MIKRARIRFIAVTMTVILIVLSVFFGCGYLFIRQSAKRATFSNLGRAEKIYRDSAKFIDDDIAVLYFPGGTITTDYYEIICGDSLFDKNSLDEIIEAAANYKTDLGSAAGLYYLVSAKDDILIFVTSDSYTAKNADILTALILILVIYLILFFIVLGSSFAIFRPIEENFYRQKRFVSDASHELRTPVAVISANADVLKNYIDKNNPYLKSIKEQTKRMETLVTDMLMLARTEEERIPLKKEEISLSDEVNQAALPYDAVLFEKGKTLVTDVAPNVNLVGDRQSFRNILNILLDNAVKHSDKNATITVTLKRETGRAVLTVKNNGSLVPDEDSAKVFQRFYRGDQSRARDSEETGGSGLGLSIAKTVADANKWKITAKSVYGVSMTITLIM